MDSIFFILQQRKLGSEVLGDLPEATPIAGARVGPRARGSALTVLAPSVSILWSSLCENEDQIVLSHSASAGNRCIFAAQERVQTTTKMMQTLIWGLNFSM